MRNSLPSCCLATRWWSGCRTRRAISSGSSSSSRRPRLSSASATTLSRCGFGSRCPWQAAADSLVIRDRFPPILGTFAQQRTSLRGCSRGFPNLPCLRSTAERHAQSHSPVADPSSPICRMAVIAWQAGGARCLRAARSGWTFSRALAARQARPYPPPHTVLRSTRCPERPPLASGSHGNAPVCH